MSLRKRIRFSDLFTFAIPGRTKKKTSNRKKMLLEKKLFSHVKLTEAFKVLVLSRKWGRQSFKQGLLHVNQKRLFLLERIPLCHQKEEKTKGNGLLYKKTGFHSSGTVEMSPNLSPKARVVTAGPRAGFEKVAFAFARMAWSQRSYITAARS